MITDDLDALIRQNFGFEPTHEQHETMCKWSDFLLSRNRDSLFLLTGYAGTGKTSLLGAFVRTMKELRLPVVLLAPTGRAAKVFAQYAQAPAYTIHKRIYRQQAFGTDRFLPLANLHKDTLFIVDEASMISNEGGFLSPFGTGRLLDDLIHYVYAGQGCRLMLVGDKAQLPPVGEEESPAIEKNHLAGYGMEVTEAELTQVVRQKDTSGILYNATLLRTLLHQDASSAFADFRLMAFPDVRTISGEELIEAIEDSYSRCGVDETIVVTRSNKRAALFNQGIRGRILGYEEELSGGDQIMVTKNNYYWIKDEEEGSISFLANGDTAIVRRYRNERSLYGFRFADVTLRFPDYDDFQIEVTVLLDTLYSEASSLSPEQQQALYQAIEEDYPELTNQRDRAKRIKEDAYFNALQIKYSYAITCHKAQGGQWQRVFIDQGYITSDMLTPQYFRWLYTALTRATERVYLINWPAEHIQDSPSL